jgi:hypothetical protein
VVVGNEVMISPEVNAVQGTRVVDRELINRRVSFLAKVRTKVSHDCESGRSSSFVKGKSWLKFQSLKVSSPGHQKHRN